MFADDVLAGVATIITALTGLVAAFAALVAARRAARIHKAIQTESGRPLGKVVSGIDHAVNDKPTGSQTMGSQVDDIHDEVVKNGGR